MLDFPSLLFPPQACAWLALLACLHRARGDAGPADYALLDAARSPASPLPFGARGPEVVALQNALAGVAHPIEPIGTPPDGVFGNATLAALTAFQTEGKVANESGLVGPATMRWFDEALGIQACPSPMLARLPQSRVTPGIEQGAVRVLDAYHAYPVGLEVPFRADNATFVGRVELHFHPWNGSMRPHGYHHGISVFYFASAARVGGSVFMAATGNLSVPQRESLILLQLAAGNQPSALSGARNVTVVAPAGQSVSFMARPDYLALGTDDDFVRMPMAAFTAQKLADLFSASVPTTLMVDAIWRAATTKIAPQPLPPGPNMTSNAYFVKENALIEAELSGAPLDAYVGGDKKDIVITNEYAAHPTSVAIYGWHRLDGQPIQPLFLGHAAWYADYSHGVRLVDSTVFVDGAPLSLADALADANLAAALSREGVMASPRIPVLKSTAPACVEHWPLE